MMQALYQEENQNRFQEYQYYYVTFPPKSNMYQESSIPFICKIQYTMIGE